MCTQFDQLSQINRHILNPSGHQQDLMVTCDGKVSPMVFSSHLLFVSFNVILVLLFLFKTFFLKQTYMYILCIFPSNFLFYIYLSHLNGLSLKLLGSLIDCPISIIISLVYIIINMCWCKIWRNWSMIKMIVNTQ